MSKEQTPIDVLVIEIIAEGGIKNTKEKIEQYAQSKVLEALEMEFSKVEISMFDEDRSSDYTEQGKFYYETEVKPKYE